MEIFEVDLSDFDGETTDERCGIIVRLDEDYFAIEVPNEAANPRRDFRISDSRTMEILAHEGLDRSSIVGVVHTHQRGFSRWPSYNDVKGLPLNLVGCVYHPSTGSRVWYDRSGFLQEDIKRSTT